MIRCLHYKFSELNAVRKRRGGKSLPLFSFSFLKNIFKRFFIHLFLERGEGREKKERNINVWLPLVPPILRTWPAIQARALTGKRTGDPLVRRLALDPLSHTSQGDFQREN